MTDRRIWLIGCVLAACTLVTASSRAAAGVLTYTYDSLGRVATAVHPNGVTVTYAYDAAGNRTGVTRGAPPPPPPPPPLTATVSVSSWTRTRSSVPPPAACTVGGGTAPYQYFWLYISGDALTETVNAPSDSQASWFRPVPSTTARISSWQCRVTDATSATANSGNVIVSVRTNG